MSVIEEQEVEEVEDQLFFVSLLKKYPVLLNKSQIPKIRNEKSTAMLELKDKLECCGKIFNEKQISKKINNMKSKVKTKSDMKQTGNRKINLLPWEKEMLNLMSRDENPSINKITAAMDVGTWNLALSDTVGTSSRPSCPPASTNITDKSSEDIPERPPKRARSFADFETEESRKLTTGELQRLLLVEQLKLTRLQTAYYENKINSFHSFNNL